MKVVFCRVTIIMNMVTPSYWCYHDYEGGVLSCYYHMNMVTPSYWCHHDYEGGVLSCYYHMKMVTPSYWCFHDYEGGGSVIVVLLFCEGGVTNIGDRSLSQLCPYCTKRVSPEWDRLVGLVVKASASRAEDPGFESRLRRDFFGVESYQ